MIPYLTGGFIEFGQWPPNFFIIEFVGIYMCCHPIAPDLYSYVASGIVNAKAVSSAHIVAFS